MSSRFVTVVALLGALAFASSCNNDNGSGDSGPVDMGRPDAGPCSDNAQCPGSYCNAGSHHCCELADPPYEICGDRIDQNCDQHDESCGDQDHDGIMACTVGQDPLSGCDCDDERLDVRPPIGTTVAGAPELCDGVDNNCNGRIDESAACCEACASLGAERTTRADICAVGGECDCAGEPGIGACATGLSCCSAGCVDVTSDVRNCGFCEAPCTNQADRCTASACSCGATGPCDLNGMCTDGMCPPPPP